MKENHIVGLTHITLKCNDFEAMCDFYGRVMGFERIFGLPYQGEMAKAHAAQGVREGDPWLAYFKIADRQFVELFNEKYDSTLHIPAYSFMHFSVLVSDIVEAARHFEAQGMTLWAGPKHVNRPYTEPYPGNKPGQCGSYAFYIQDPEGNEIEVMQYTENSMQLLCDR